MIKEDNHKGILLSCYYIASVKGENIITGHAFAYQISGSLIVRGDRETVVFEPGDFRFNVRNKLAKFVKQPAENEPFRSLSLTFDEDILREFAKEHQLSSAQKPQTNASFQLKKHPLYQSFIDSLQASLSYFEEKNEEIRRHKLKEALLILLKVQPELKDILFDFDDPGKISLQAFMEANFRYNLSLARLAYLTGRSMSGFKRDFTKAYHTTPAKWLMQRRLDEAYYLLKEQKQRTTDVYVEVGFENLSHFSFVFKKHFGLSPAEVNKSAG